MKKLFTILLAALLLFSVCGVMAVQASEDTGTAPPNISDTDDGTEPTDPVDPTNPADPEDPAPHEGIVSLEGKTVMIVGNSMVYYGNCVIYGDAGKEDYGYFYQLAAAHDENVTVLDYTYSGKKLDYIYENYLVKLSEEQREQVDYLVLSEGNQVNEDLVGTCEKILALFPEDVEFRFLRQPMMFESDMPCLIQGVEDLRAAGYTVVDWGKLVYDIHSGATQVPGATLEFNRCSFMKENLGYKNGPGTVLNPDKSGDRNHENPLSGYITAQMLYTSITNRSAVYTDYTFCYDTGIHPYFDIDQFAQVHYTGPDKTNFHEIFRSPQDMLGLQQLMDAYLRAEGKHPLVIQPAVKPTCTRGGLTEGSYCALCDQIIDQQQWIPADTIAAHQLVFLKGAAATCTENGKTVGAYCELCGDTLMYQEIIPFFGHSPELRLTQATVKADGALKNICTTCGEVLESQPIPKIAAVTLSKTSYIYNGLEQKPTVTVTDTAGNTLVEGTDYTLTYSSGRIEVKNYKVTVRFIGNYKGAEELVYKIRPTATTSFAATAYLKTVKLTWRSVQKATHYRIYMYDSATGTYKKVADTAKTSYKVTGLKTGTKYKFKIKAFTHVGDRTYYSAQNKYVTTMTKPSTTTLNTLTAGKKTATLSWKKITSASGYEIVYSTSKSFKNARTVTVSKQSTLKMTVKNLSSRKVYYFKVRTYNTLSGKKIYGSYSNVKRVRIK